MRFALIASVFLIACGESPTAAASGGLQLTAVSGNAQVVPADTFAPTALTVTVTLNAQPVIGDSVTFLNLSPHGVFLDGGPVFDQVVAVTDSTGTARARLLTSTQVGVDSVRASVVGAAPVIFTASVVPGAAYGFAKFAGDAQTAPAGSALATLPAVKATDQFGNAVPGVIVTFMLTGGGGSISGASVVTGANGVAMLGSWTLGGVPGTNTVTAFMQLRNGAIPFPFTETATAP